MLCDGAGGMPRLLRYEKTAQHQKPAENVPRSIGHQGIVAHRLGDGLRWCPDPASPAGGLDLLAPHGNEQRVGDRRDAYGKTLERLLACT
jgi:hypothetical protein